MRRAIATVSLSGTLRAKLEAAAAAGFDAVELFEPDFISHRGDAAEVRTICADLGLGIDLYQPFRDFEGMPEALFERSLDRAERKFDLMQALGAPLVLVCSNTSPQSLGEPERAAAQLHALAERAARRNLRVGFEALAWGRWTKRYGEAWGIVERAAHPQLGLILDSFHTLSLRDDPAGIAAIPGARIFFVQMADAPLLGMDVLQWARHHRNFPGQGDFDCEGFFAQVLRAGYAGTLSLEIFNDVFRATPNRRTALDAMRSLLFLESRVRERLAGPSSVGDGTARRHALGVAVPPVPHRTELFDPPRAEPLDGYAFLEFGSDAAVAAELGAWLERFGFVRVGRHRTKAVDLYRQGEILLVVNAEPGSVARERFEAQGPGVGTVGLATADPLRAANRAAALLSARRDSPRGAGERVLPAILAPGGLVLQFMPTGQTMEADFGAAVDSTDAVDAVNVADVVEAADVAAAGAPRLTRIDHIAVGLANDQLDTWMLFSRAVLGLEPGTSHELADPFGLIRSAGLANPARAVRLVLNVSSSERTRAARQLNAAGRPGASVQHVAFACDDIFTTIAVLRARGVRFVPISANYYDDLIARLGLDEPFVRRMQAGDILFDGAAEPARGRYFHAYSESYAGRFFIEIVQREGGYDAYGAANAPARLASEEEGAVGGTRASGG